MKRLKTSIALAALCVCSGLAQAQSLVDLYEAARGYDASFLAAKKQFDANVARVDQAVAALLPVIGFSGQVTRFDYAFKYAPITNSTGANIGTNYNIPERYFGQRTYGLSLSQPLYRPGNLVTYNQGQKQLMLADAAIQSAEQDLLVRVSQAYFDVLAAQDSLIFVQAQKTAVGEQLAAAKRNFEVGTSTITDTREAQARFDLTTAQEISAQNDVRVKQLALDNLVGKDAVKPWRLKSAAVLPTLKDGEKDSEMSAWTEAAQKVHPSVRSAQINLDVAKLETDRASAGHKPTLDLSVSAQNITNTDGTAQGTTNAGNSRLFAGSAALVLNIPLYAGGATQNIVKEKLALESKAAIDLENAKRTVTQSTRTAYLGLQSGLGTVKAFEAAEASSQSALDANKLGYQVGVRINIDVLNSQSQLFQTKRDLAKARYDVLMGHLRLRQANGSLKAADLAPINALLAQ